MSGIPKLSFFSRIGTKILIVCLMFFIPIATLTRFMVNAKNKDIEFASQELKGNRYQRALGVIFEGVLQHQWLLQRVLNGETAAANALEAHEKNVRSGLAYLLPLDAELGQALQFTAEGLETRKRQNMTALALSQKWENLLANGKTLTPSKRNEAYGDLTTHLRTMMTHVGDTSNLILDPDLDSYYLMDVTLLALPQIQERLSKAIAFVESLLRSGRLTQADRVEAAVLAALLKQSDRDRVVASAETALNEDPQFYGVSESLQQNLRATLTPFQNKTDAFIQSINSLSQVKSLRDFNVTEFRKQAHEALSQSFRSHEVGFKELDSLLEKRIRDIRGGLWFALQLTALALVVSALLAYAIARGMVGKLGHITHVARNISAGDYTARTQLKGQDEVAQLGESFDAMTTRVLALSSEVRAKNQELSGINQNLEHMINERAAAIKVILDNVKFGFFLIDKTLKIQGTFSKSCHDLLNGNIKQGQHFCDVLNISERDRPLVQLNLEQVFQDLLPEDMSTSQLPPNVRLNGKYVSVQCSPVRNPEGAVTQLLFTISDNTAKEQAERENHHHKILVQILKQIDAFRDYVAETKHRAQEAASYLQEGDEHRVRAELHTIKGNSAAFGLVELATLVHEIEDQSDIGSTHLETIEQNLKQFLKDNHSVLQISYDHTDSEVFQLHKNQLLELGDIIASQSQSPRESLEDKVFQWIEGIQLKPADALLGIIPDYVVELAKRLGKQVRFHLEGEAVLLPPERFKNIIKTMVHLIRNCVDHGIEFPYERNPKGEEGHIHMTFLDTESHWSIELRDDGRGIDFDRLGKTAIEKGLISKEDLDNMPAEKKQDLLFMDGLSTASEVSDISGRGVGMSAIRHAVEHAGGTIQVSTQPGTGSTFSILIPKRTRHKARANRRLVKEGAGAA